MKQPEIKQNQFINPYRQNKRWFSKYLNKPSNITKESQNSSEITDILLDGVSKASSIKIKQSINQPQIFKPLKKVKQQEQVGNMICNKRKNIELQNPQIFDLISKHIQSGKKIANIPSNQRQKPYLKSKSSQKGSIIQLGIFKLQKTPKITQFTRLTFYRNNSFSKNKYQTKKQNEDNLHSKSNLSINIKKISLCKKTKTNSDKKQFYTYEIYSLNDRIGINVEIIQHNLKQIKFRLILNQYDTKTFNIFWKSKIQQFIQKCLIVNDLGISLRIKSFNQVRSNSQSKISRLKQFHKIYLEKRSQSIVKKQQNRKLSAKKIGSKLYSMEYDGIDVENNKNKNEEQIHINEIGAKIEDKQQADPKNSQKEEQKPQIIETAHIQPNMAAATRNDKKITNIQSSKKQNQQYIESFNSLEFRQQVQVGQQNNLLQQKDQYKVFQQGKPQQAIHQQSKD